MLRQGQRVIHIQVNTTFGIVEISNDIVCKIRYCYLEDGMLTHQSVSYKIGLHDVNKQWRAI